MCCELLSHVLKTVVQIMNFIFVTSALRYELWLFCLISLQIIDAWLVCDAGRHHIFIENLLFHQRLVISDPNLRFKAGIDRSSSIYVSSLWQIQTFSILVFLNFLPFAFDVDVKGVDCGKAQLLIIIHLWF